MHYSLYRTLIFSFALSDCTLKFHWRNNDFFLFYVNCWLFVHDQASKLVPITKVDSDVSWYDGYNLRLSGEYQLQTRSCGTEVKTQTGRGS